MLNSHISRSDCIAYAKERLAAVTLGPAQLWAAAVAAWGATAAVAAAGLPEEAYTAVLGVALTISLAAIQSATVARRLDRQYQAMMQAAILLRIPGPAPEAEGVVVQFPGKAQPARGAIGE